MEVYGKFDNIEKAVATHLKGYRAGRRNDPRITNTNIRKDNCGMLTPMPLFDDAYLAEWDRQCLLARAKMFKKGVA